MPVSWASEHIFGFSCVNDVTAFDLLKQHAGFDQWSRIKGFDTFCAVGPCITTDLHHRKLRIKTIINGAEVKQDYPAADMIFSPKEIVSYLSHYMTLLPGDIICCGTSKGLEPMELGDKVEINIQGIGTLSNTYGA